VPIVLVILAVAFLVLFYLLVRGSSPSLGKMLVFLLLLVVGAALAYLFLINVLRVDPNPYRLKIANYLTKNKLIDLTQIVPGLNNLNDIYRADTDGDAADKVLEWLVFYRYDVTTTQDRVSGPFGAAIYDVNHCRPPAIPSYELAPVSYNYLGQDGAWPVVENAIPYPDPLSANLDRPEVFIAGVTRGAVTDLNIFRKVGTEPDCLQCRTGSPSTRASLPYGDWMRYANIGSFRGNYAVRRNGSTIVVVDRAGFERSQFTVETSYRPQDGSYFKAGTQTLRDPVEYGLAFGPGEPDQVSPVLLSGEGGVGFLQGPDQKCDD